MQHEPLNTRQTDQLLITILPKQTDWNKWYILRKEGETLQQTLNKKPFFLIHILVQED